MSETPETNFVEQTEGKLEPVTGEYEGGLDNIEGNFADAESIMAQIDTINARIKQTTNLAQLEGQVDTALSNAESSTEAVNKLAEIAAEMNMSNLALMRKRQREVRDNV